MHHSLRWLGLIAGVCLVLAACSERGDGDSDLSGTLDALWETRKSAIVDADADALEAVETGNALRSDRVQWVDYRFDPGTVTDPQPDATPTVVAIGEGGSSVVAVVVEPWGAFVSEPTWTLLRADGDGDSWKFSFLLDNPEPDLTFGSTPAELRPASDRGMQLLELAAAFRLHVWETGSLPATVPFGPGRFSSGFVDIVASQKELEPGEVRSRRVQVDSELTARIGFVFDVPDGELACGVLREVESVRMADGAEMNRTILGDLAVYLADGSYVAFVTTEMVELCVLDRPDDEPLLVAANPVRVAVVGTPV